MTYYIHWAVRYAHPIVFIHIYVVSMLACSHDLNWTMIGIDSLGIREGQKFARHSTDIGFANYLPYIVYKILTVVSWFAISFWIYSFLCWSFVIYIFLYLVQVQCIVHYVFISSLYAGIHLAYLWMRYIIGAASTPWPVLPSVILKVTVGLSPQL